MEFTADAGTGQVFGGLDWTNAAAPTGISTTNLKYQYSYDNGTPSYNGSWLTLAQLQAVGAVAGNYRYIRLRVQLNSDGATQNYGAEVNASDLIDGVFAQLSPDAPSWNGLPTAGDGQVTLPVTTVNPTDVVYARYKRFQALGGWSAESETLKRTGSGNIVVTGLTNEVGYEFTIYTKSGVLTSDWIGPRYRTPTDGSASFIERVMNAVVDDLNTATIADPSGTTLVAAKEIPPDFNDVATGCFKVFPDTELAAAARNRNDITPRVTIAYCQRSKTAAQRTTQMYIREQVRDLFLGRRLTSLPEAICVAETESGVVDLDNLWQHFQWISPITLEFSAMRRRG